MSLLLTFLWPLRAFKLSWSPCSYDHTLRNTWIFSKLYSDIFHINISDDFNVDLGVTFVTFQTRSSSTYLVSTTIMRKPCKLKIKQSLTVYKCTQAMLFWTGHWLGQFQKKQVSAVIVWCFYYIWYYNYGQLYSKCK